jgi:hypothetical protein
MTLTWPAKLAGIALVLAVLAVAAVFVIGWNPFKSPAKAIAKEQHKDAAASTKIETKGAQAVTKDVQAAASTQTKAQAQVEYVTRTVRLSPTGSSPIPADRLDRLRAADSELCRLGVDCEGGGQEPGGPASAPASGVGPGAVPALRPARQGAGR